MQYVALLLYEVVCLIYVSYSCRFVSHHNVYFVDDVYCSCVIH